jgi:hypothetical protein
MIERAGDKRGRETPLPIKIVNIYDDSSPLYTIARWLASGKWRFRREK